MIRAAPVGFAFALLMGALSCKAPEIEACDDFLSALRACTDQNALPSGPGEEKDGCTAVDPACEAYLRCGASAPCEAAEGETFVTLDLSGCAPPEGIDCP
ncbi:MAG: hypothetical protein R3B09_29500 [Nannocystaceae bacterium]